MNALQVFENHDFGQVRCVEFNGKPYAVGVDVARALGYAKPSQAVIDHCKGIRKLGIPSDGGIQETNIISEGDIYRLIIKAADQSKSKEIRDRAEKFERWVFDEIIPSILKTGTYSAEPLPKYQDERIRAGIEIFRSVDVNNMKATGQVALFNTIGKLFAGQVATTAISAGQNPFSNSTALIVTETSMLRRADAEKALTWLREAYAKYGDKLGQVQEKWLLVQRSHWKSWAKRNQLNLTLVLKELHNQGIVRKFYGSSGRYSYPARIDGLRVSAVWINLKLSGLTDMKLSSSAGDDDSAGTTAKRPGIR